MAVIGAVEADLAESTTCTDEPEVEPLVGAEIVTPVLLEVVVVVELPTLMVSACLNTVPAEFQACTTILWEPAAKLRLVLILAASPRRGNSSSPELP